MSLLHELVAQRAAANLTAAAAFLYICLRTHVWRRATQPMSPKYRDRDRVLASVTHGQLAREAGVTVRTVHTYLRELARAGWIRVLTSAGSTPVFELGRVVDRQEKFHVFDDGTSAAIAEVVGSKATPRLGATSAKFSEVGGATSAKFSEVSCARVHYLPEHGSSYVSETILAERSADASPSADSRLDEMAIVRGEPEFAEPEDACDLIGPGSFADPPVPRDPPSPDPDFFFSLVPNTDALTQPEPETETMPRSATEPQTLPQVARAPLPSAEAPREATAEPCGVGVEADLLLASPVPGEEPSAGRLGLAASVLDAVAARFREKSAARASAKLGADAKRAQKLQNLRGSVQPTEVRGNVSTLESRWHGFFRAYHPGLPRPSWGGKERGQAKQLIEALGFDDAMATVGFAVLCWSALTRYRGGSVPTIGYVFACRTSMVADAVLIRPAINTMLRCMAHEDANQGSILYPEDLAEASLAADEVFKRIGIDRGKLVAALRLGQKAAST